ncbi:hypothetical protein KCP73_16890 [Salmonella enterica subsp. enterica]|nr:hypothetical protein KCP73_16890 [Salmonella enterica subsp. enterica]
MDGKLRWMRYNISSRCHIHILVCKILTELALKAGADDRSLSVMDMTLGVVKCVPIGDGIACWAAFKHGRRRAMRRIGCRKLPPTTNATLSISSCRRSGSPLAYER